MQNRILTFAILISFFAFALTGCMRTKDAFLSDYHSFMDEVDDKHKKYDEDDWEEKNEEMKVFLEKDFKDFEEEMSRSEKTEVMAEAYKYYIYQHKEKALTKIRAMDEEQFEVMMDHLDNVMDDGLKFLDEIEPELVGIGEEFMEFGNKFINEMKDRGMIEKLEEMGKKLEDVGKKLEEKAEEIEKRNRSREL